MQARGPRGSKQRGYWGNVGSQILHGVVLHLVNVFVIEGYQPEVHADEYASLTVQEVHSRFNSRTDKCVAHIQFHWQPPGPSSTADAGPGSTTR